MKLKLLVLASIGFILTLFMAVNVVTAQGPTPKSGRSPQIALGTGFTYQGQLKNAGSAVNGSCDFQFGLWDHVANNGVLSVQVGVTQTVSSIAVSNGLFTVQLNNAGQFGMTAFNGDARFLSTAARCPAGTGSYNAIFPRQELTAMPYALYATNGPFWSLIGNSGTNASTNFVGTMDNVSLTLRANNVVGWRLMPNGANTPNLIGGNSGNGVTSGVKGATIGGGGMNGALNRVTDDYGVIGGGSNNQAGDNAGTTSDKSYATIGGGYSNAAGGNISTVAGGYSNTASNSQATVSGGYINTASGYISTIGGGASNTASNQYATVSGGSVNNASNTNATVSGGYFNDASGHSATISGGYNNTASGDQSTVGGGENDTASGYRSTVGGGNFNTASGDYSTVPGGYFNTATMSYTLATGRQARAINQGAFVWADSTDASFSSTANDQFLVRANGGVGINTNSPAANTLTVGGTGLRVATDGTTLKRIQAGQATLNSGIAGTNVYTITFPSAFDTTPMVNATLALTNSSYNDTFALTVRQVTTTQFVVNVYRVDMPGNSWGQGLKLNWYAWE